MQITVEISLYPLQEAYGNEVLSFLKTLKKGKDLQVRTNNVSTQITGEFDEIIPQLMSAMKHTLQKEHKSSFVMKVFNEGLELDWLDL